MKLEHLAVLFRALADKADELAELEASEADARSEQREAERREKSAGDIEAAVAVVAARPGLTTRQIISGLVLSGLSAERSQRAIDGALAAGLTVAVPAGRSLNHFLAGDAPDSKS